MVTSKRSPGDIRKLSRKIRNRKEFFYRTFQVPIKKPVLTAMRKKAPAAVLISRKMSFKQKEKEAVTFVQATIQQYALPYCVSFSGGKDSLVLGHIIKKINPNVEMVFCDTTNEFPDLINHVKNIARRGWNIKIVKPNITFKECLQKFGPPGRRRRWCTKILKIPPLFVYNKKFVGQKVLVFVGIRANESPRRRQYERVAETVAISPVGMFRLRQITAYPIFYFSEKDIWDYIKKHDLSYCSLYDDPRIRRIGCMFCPFTSREHDRVVAEHCPQESKEWHDYLKKYAKDNGLAESWAEGAWRNNYGITKYATVGTKEVIGRRIIRYRLQKPFLPHQKNFLMPFRKDPDVKIKFFPGNKTILVSQLKWKPFNTLLHVEVQILKALNCINCGWCQIVCNHISIGKDGKIYIKDSCTGCLRCTYKTACMVFRFGEKLNIVKNLGSDRWGRKKISVY